VVVVYVVVKIDCVAAQALLAVTVLLWNARVFHETSRAVEPLAEACTCTCLARALSGASELEDLGVIVFKDGGATQRRKQALRQDHLFLDEFDLSFVAIGFLSRPAILVFLRALVHNAHQLHATLLVGETLSVAFGMALLLGGEEGTVEELQDTLLARPEVTFCGGHLRISVHEGQQVVLYLCD